MNTAEAGFYLISTDQTTFLNSQTIPPSVAFMAYTDGFGYWNTLDGGIINGSINTLMKVGEEK